MPFWVVVQIVVGLVLGVTAMLPGMRQRSMAYLLGDLACSVCGAAMLMAYHNIRVNAAIGGWVIVLFGYSLLWHVGFVASSVGLYQGLEVPRWDVQWIRDGASRLQVARFAIFLLPALYLGGVLTARIWYPPPLRDQLTYGTPSAAALKAKLERMIPPGATRAEVRDSVEQHGFHCVNRPDEVQLGGTYTHLGCNTRDFAADSSLQLWQLLLVFRNDSLVDIRIALTTHYR